MQKGVCFVACEGFKRSSFLTNEVYKYLKDLLEHENVSNFFFSEIDAFSQMCFEVVNFLKKQYPYIKTFYVQAKRNFKRFEKSFDNHILYNDVGVCKNNIHIKTIEKLLELSDYCVSSFIEGEYNTNFSINYKEVILTNAEKMKKIIKNIT